LAKPRFELVQGPENLEDYKEGATQTFKRGDIVKMSSGLVVLATGTGIAANMLGVAAADASGTTSAAIPVVVFSGEQVFCAYAPTASAPTANSLGVDYAIKQAAAAGGEISTATGTDGIAYRHTAQGKDGTANGDPFLIKIDQSRRQMEVG
jgi:hypothetical protein